MLDNQPYENHKIEDRQERKSKFCEGQGFPIYKWYTYLSKNSKQQRTSLHIIKQESYQYD